MLKPRSLWVSLLLAALICFAPQLALRAQAQQSDAQNQFKLYKDAKENLKKGAYAKALKEVEAYLLKDPDYASAYMIKGQAQLGIFAAEYSKAYYAGGKRDASGEAFIPLAQALESFEHYLSLTPQAADANHWRREIQRLRPFAEITENGNPQRTVFLGDEIPATKARILKKPLPRYPEAARLAQINGDIVLLAVLSADGTVKNIFPLNELSHGLTEQAVEAARKIKFEPATKDGHPVSQVIAVEYSFMVYTKR